MNDLALHASKDDVFCGDCAFYEPYGPTHRCRHPSAVQEFKTYVGLAKRFIEPEDKNAHNDCADFKARPVPKLSRDSVLVFYMVGLTGLVTTVWLLYGFYPWVPVTVGAGIPLCLLLRE
jgi:hypothetical protein